MSEPFSLPELKRIAREKSYPRCATCKWWKKYDYDGHAGDCLSSGNGKTSWTLSDEGYKLPITTSISHGCVLHEEKA